MRAKLKIGSRGSRLARAQTELVADALRRRHPDLTVEIEIIRTSGDRFTDAALAQLATDVKGLFVKELEESLLSNTIDIAVHSLKDLPTQLPEGLAITAIPEREDPRDVLVSHQPMRSLAELPVGARIGTSSLRRRVQLKHQRADIEIVAIRGNIDTRIRKLETEGLHGVLLAAAGLRRLGLDSKISYCFPADEMVPAVGQGALAIETRSDDHRTRELLAALEHAPTRACAEAERSFLASLGGGCQVPMGAHAWFADEKRPSFAAFLASPDLATIIAHSTTGSCLEELVDQAVQHFLREGASRALDHDH